MKEFIMLMIIMRLKSYFKAYLVYVGFILILRFTAKVILYL